MLKPFLCGVPPEVGADIFSDVVNDSNVPEF